MRNTEVHLLLLARRSDGEQLKSRLNRLDSEMKVHDRLQWECIAAAVVAAAVLRIR